MSISDIRKEDMGKCNPIFLEIHARRSKWQCMILSSSHVQIVGTR